MLEELVNRIEKHIRETSNSHINAFEDAIRTIIAKAPYATATELVELEKTYQTTRDKLENALQTAAIVVLRAKQKGVEIDA